ncbi:Golgi-associated olfactory signaling regulator isoform X2 [Hemicordylus capensis]|uniref:Golgi-associated olfactory signaling regulator isoform X2 n=1 Tax=Hemicordylus capensis TaxID=884348 RepID=UPI00230328C0|nr:Golgi-associated olfactory signaling regulator isoform X2 [Hemicordylus capensis]
MLWTCCCIVTVNGSIDYPVSLYYEDARLSTLIWLRPAYCLYEMWHREALDPSQASQQTTAIEVEVKPEGVNSTYKIARRFPVPYCGPFMDQPLVTKDFAYEMGPTLACLNDTCTKAVLPGRGFSVRYLLYNQAQTLLAATNWSGPFYTRGIRWCDCLKMNLFYLGSLLVLGTSYTAANAEFSPSLPSSPSPFPTDWSSTSQMSPESTQDPESPLTPGSNTTFPPNSSSPQQNQTQTSVPTQQTKRPRLFQEKAEGASFKLPSVDTDYSPGAEPWEAAAGGVAIVLMKPKGHLAVGEPHGATSHAMGLFLGGCGLLLCLFIGVYCAYSWGSKKEPFSHHRLYEDGFDDPALFLDSPKDYDWFFYETDGYVYPTPSQTHPQPIQTLSIPALKQPPPARGMSPEKPDTSEAAQDPQQPQASPMKLECLSPANLHSGNFI